MLSQTVSGFEQSVDKAPRREEAPTTGLVCSLPRPDPRRSRAQAIQSRLDGWRTHAADLGRVRGARPSCRLRRGVRPPGHTRPGRDQAGVHTAAHRILCRRGPAVGECQHGAAARHIRRPVRAICRPGPEPTGAGRRSRAVRDPADRDGRQRPTFPRGSDGTGGRRPACLPGGAGAGAATVRQRRRGRPEVRHAATQDLPRPRVDDVTICAQPVDPCSG